jgi:hypothetical protein
MRAQDPELYAVAVVDAGTARGAGLTLSLPMF